MRLASINVSPGVDVPWQGKTVNTGIFKKPVAGRVMVRRNNIDGDRQSDLAVHGGEFKAVYAYSLAHYAWWREELGGGLPLGMFGENLTVDGLVEEDVCIGDVLRVGGASLQAVQPRLPCFKLGIRFSDSKIVKRFRDSGRWGVYFRVLEEGEIGVGDEASVIRRDPDKFPVPELARLYYSRPRDPARVRRLLGLAALPPHWVKEFKNPRGG